MRQEMTKKEKVIFDYIVGYRTARSFSPSMREIAEAVGLRSASTVCRHIHSLEDKGWISTNEGRSHAIIPVDD